ncbi:MAG: toll/interleukin-1 receptor domain-containing protein [Chloroflexi bacterium]|nr:MAG: toll/interleukin-1 receptor domain-containing protein [Chloroflexota bacterium]
MANQEQLEILKQGVDVWNKWREEKFQVKIDFKEADLRGAILIGANFEGVDLRRAKLNGADLRGALLNKANLREANLDGTDLRGADFIEAKLNAASLRGANLKGANLHRAYLKGSDLSGAKLEGADLRFSDVSAEYPNRSLYSDVPREYSLQNSPVRNIPSRLRGQLSELVEDRNKFEIIKLPQSEDVLFTAIYPRENKVEEWRTLLVYVHLATVLQDVRQDAQRFKDQIPMPKEVISSTTRITRGTEITIIPSCDGLVFNPDRIVVRWMENYHRADFRFWADKSLATDVAKGQINFYVGPIMVGNLKFAMLFNEPDSQTFREDEIHAVMYRQEDIFVSYSHKDSAIVLACKKAYQALGFNVLIDIETLRSGQLWNEELAHMIDNATIFQLFWSENSKKSKYCKQEWKHALKRNTQGFIRPLYWQKPITKPPRELSKYHFEYVEF